MSEHHALELTSRDALITGYPGFLAAHLLRALDARQPQATFHLLVLPAMEALARQRLSALAVEAPALAKRCVIHRGDITRERLGLDDDSYALLTQRVGVVWHLAALYDLAVSSHIAYRVNVTGTLHILDFCERCDAFARLNYVSTCYVSGDRTGVIREDELDERQRFKNHYEETKFWAEVEVQRRMEAIPTAILRPGIVVGDSRTGHTDKYDGPYYLFKLLSRLPQGAPVPYIGHGEAVVTLVPVDYVVGAMTHLGLKAGAQGQVYQIVDPDPMRARDITALALRLLGHKPARLTIPAKLAQLALRSERLEAIAGVPRETLVYFNHPARYDATHTLRALQDAPGVRCPHLSSYLGVLLDAMRRQPDKPFLDDRRL